MRTLTDIRNASAGFPRDPGSLHKIARSVKSTRTLEFFCFVVTTILLLDELPSNQNFWPSEADLLYLMTQSKKTFCVCLCARALTFEEMDESFRILLDG